MDAEHTEADLVARIADDPDDDAAYLVYADFLLGRGDPRGELIALQLASAGDPAKQKSADRHLKAHRARLLGELAEHASQVKLEWRAGFARRARIIADDESSAIRLVDAVADSPACAFLRRLEVVILGRRRSYLAIEQRLVELARPGTLREIVLGKPGDHRLAPQLLAAFPRARPAAESWDEVVGSVSALRGRAPAIDVAQLAPLPTKTGAPLPLDMAAVMRGLAAEAGKKQSLGLLAMLDALCSRDALDRFSASLVERWHLEGDAAATSWVYDVASLLGGPRSARAIARYLGEVSHARAIHALDCLVRMRTPLALLELYAATGLWSARGEHAEILLARIARQANTSIATLLARTGASSGIEPLDGDTAARFRELDGLVLEMLMVTGWTTTLATAIELFALAPRAAWAVAIVWALPRASEPPSMLDRLRFWDRKRKSLVTPLRLGPDGAFDLDGNPITVEPDAHIAIAHALELGTDELERWQAWQRAQATPFSQLDRVTELPKGASTLDAIRAITNADSFPSFEGLRSRGYRNGNQRDEMHGETLLVKTYRYRDHSYTVRVDFAQRVITSAPKDLPPIVAHELARDVVAATLDAW